MNENPLQSVESMVVIRRERDLTAYDVSHADVVKMLTDEDEEAKTKLLQKMVDENDVNKRLYIREEIIKTDNRLKKYAVLKDKVNHLLTSALG